MSIHAVNGDNPRGPGLFQVRTAGQDGEYSLISNVRRLAGRERPPGSVLIMAATWLLAVLDAGLLYVSFDAQYRYIFAVKDAKVPSMIEAAMLDAGMVILSALGIGLALRGKASTAQRALIVLCAFASAGMNYAAADTASWRSVAAYVAAPVFLAVITDRVISVIRRHVLPDDTESAWSWLGRAALAALKLTGIVTLYALRAALAPAQTLAGLRRMVLDAAPVPGIIKISAEPAEPELMPGPGLPAGVFFAAHGGITPHLTLDHAGQLALCTGCPRDVSEDEEPPEFASKREAFEWHFRRHPQFGDRAAMSQVARLIGERVGLQWGTSRTYAAAILAADAMDAARECDQEAQR
jgi:CBS domain-containing protein